MNMKKEKNHMTNEGAFKNNWTGHRYMRGRNIAEKKK